MSRLDPAVADADRTVEDPGDTEALESLDRSHDVDERVHGAHLVEGDLRRRHAVDRAFGLAQELERANGPLAHPAGHGGALDPRDQIPDVPVGTVALRALVMSVVGVMIVGMAVRQDRLRRRLVRPVRQRHGHLGGPNAAPVHGADGHAHLGNAEPRGELFQPGHGRPGGHEGPQEHVAAHPCGRVEDGKTSISHRLINMAVAQVRGKPPGSR